MSWFLTESTVPSKDDRGSESNPAFVVLLICGQNSKKRSNIGICGPLKGSNEVSNTLAAISSKEMASTSQMLQFSFQSGVQL